MANSTSTNPIVIDTYTADVVVSTGRITVSSIVMEGASAGDTATFIEGRPGGSVEVLRLSNTVNGGSIVWTPSVPFTFQHGLTFDDSASSLATNDFIFIYLA